MLRKLITKILAPFRWAVRFELQRRKMIDLCDLEGELQHRALEDTADFIEENMMPIDSVDLSLDILNLGIKQAENKQGLYLEFGVFSGRTINHIARQADQAVYGFDSFEGLPERWRHTWGAGHFKMTKLPRVVQNVTVIKGWFNKTLRNFSKQGKLGTS
jgi:hypothetical protein